LRVGVGRVREGEWRWWCRFNASILTQEGRRQNEMLSKDEVKAISSSWLHRKEA
jgi:hypothetical protein